MLLKGIDNSEVELMVVGYQFPQLKHEQYDSDWLNISIRVKHPRGNWTTTDPCMLTWEVAHLSEWLESIARNEPVDSEESFMEPNLRFELRREPLAKLRVYFELECRPPWADAYESGKMKDIWLEFDVDSEDLRNAAASLRADLMRFPVRVGF